MERNWQIHTTDVRDTVIPALKNIKNILMMSKDSKRSSKALTYCFCYFIPSFRRSTALSAGTNPLDRLLIIRDLLKAISNV